ncbi:MAG: hypothetical protein QOE76_444, partial [Frankiales bacterium]|nr:hypothetical protein [Frankiales bacterium]
DLYPRMSEMLNHEPYAADSLSLT